MKTKRTFKSVIAMLLAVILSLGTLTVAFAANDSSFTWTVDGETATCVYHSDLALGTNTVTIEESDYYYFDISDLENGYYSVKTSERFYEYMCTPEKSGNEYIGWGDMELTDEMNQIIFNRNDKVDVVVIGAHCTAENVTVEVEYLGSVIESVELFSENSEEILYYDIDEYDTGEYGANFDTAVTFDSGKTFEEESLRYWFDVEGGLKKGENTVTLDFAGHEFEKVLNVALISDYISGVEADIPEHTAAKIYYDYYIDSDYCVEQITVNFTDGTKQTVNLDKYPYTVTLPNGREVEIHCVYTPDINTLEYRLIVAAGGNSIGFIKLNAEKASHADNIRHLSENIKWFIDRTEDRFEQALLMMKAGMVQEAFVKIGYAFKNIGSNIGSIINEIGLFISFMLR